MPILYVHGVNTRNRDGFLAMEGFLRRYVAPTMAADAENVLTSRLRRPRRSGPAWSWPRTR